MTSPTAHRPRLVALRGQLGLKLLDGPDADAVKLRQFDDANARLEIGDDGRCLVNWNGRAAEPHAAGAGASLAGKDTFADHLAFKFSEHARHLQQRLSARSRRIDGLRVKVEADAVSLKVNHECRYVGERPAEPVDAPRRDDVELPASGVLVRIRTLFG